MGTSISRDLKVDIDSIRKIVREFNDKINEEKKISPDVKIQILGALQCYSKLIESLPRKKQNRNAIETKFFILNTIQTLEHTPIYKYEPSKSANRISRNVSEIKTYLVEIEKRLNANRIREDEFEEVFKNVITYAKELNRLHHPRMRPHEQDDLSFLFLKLYIKSPSQLNTNILKTIQDNLVKIIDDFEKWRKKDVANTNLEAIISELEKIKTCADTISKESTQHLNNLKAKRTPRPSKIVNKQPVRNSQKVTNAPKPPEKQTSIEHEHSLNRKQVSVVKQPESNNENELSLNRKKVSVVNTPKPEVNASDLTTVAILNEVEESLSRLEKFVASFSSRMDEVAMNQIKNQINELINNKLSEISQEDSAIVKRKKLLYSKGMYIINKLVQTNKERQSASEHLQYLQNVEEKIVAIVDSKKSFQEKKDSLESCADSLNQINTSFQDVSFRKNVLLNKIDALVIALTENYLKQTKKVLQHHKEYVQQFGFPKQSKLYEDKMEEIRGLALSLGNLLNGNEYIYKRVKSLQEEVDTVLEMLTEKATKNEEIVSTLRYLENSKNELSFIDSSTNQWKAKLRAFNGWRERVSTLDIVHPRVVAKKLDFFNTLHALEVKIYSAKFASSVAKIKMLLDDFEKSLQQPQSLKMCQQRKTEVSNLKRNAYDVCQGSRIGREEADILIGNFDIVLAALERIINECRHTSQMLDDLKTMEQEIMSPNLVKRNREKLVSIQKLAKSRKVLSKATVVETKINSELQILRSREIKTKLEQFEIDGLAFALERSVFQKQIAELFYLHEIVDDMPEDSQDLQAKKQTFSARIYSIMQQLDKSIVRIVSEDAKHENILELRSNFPEFNPQALRVSTGSAEFVQLIIRRAESFEKSIEQYLGDSYSVDYYVIHENLMRLLEELDKSNCTSNEHLLNLTVQAINYIKALINRLQLNATNS